jgi:hypothetical protein
MRLGGFLVLAAACAASACEPGPVVKLPSVQEGAVMFWDGNTTAGNVFIRTADDERFYGQTEQVLPGDARLSLLPMRSGGFIDYDAVEAADLVGNKGHTMQCVVQTDGAALFGRPVHGFGRCIVSDGRRLIIQW